MVPPPAVAVFPALRVGVSVQRALGVKVPARQAEAVRRRLLSDGLLRDDLRVRHEGRDVIFPVSAAPREFEMGRFEFEEKEVRARGYAELLPEALREAAPRAFDALGDMVLVKVPPALWDQRALIGEALQRFHHARAVFHDRGVTGVFRTRDLERIAGVGGSKTTVAENGVQLRIDPARAYFSPRLADERARIVTLAAPGERVIDLFGGVAPLGVQLARKGCQAVSVDLNPEAAALARENARLNNVGLDVIADDARSVSVKAGHRIVMNLPHGARAFLDVAERLARRGATIHFHEIMPRNELADRSASVVDALEHLGRRARVVHTRHVRDYSTTEAHCVLDVRLD